MEEVILKLSADECRMLLGMMDWAWREGGVRAEQQAVMLLLMKKRIVTELDGVGKQKPQAPEGGTHVDAG